MVIRRATWNDIEWLLIELKKFSDFFDSKYQLVGPDRSYNVALLKDLISNHFFLIAENGDEPVGFISGYVHSNPYNPAIKQITETFWWVHEDHRSSSAGGKLFAEFIKYGKEHCQWIVMTLESISPVKPESLIKRGFKVKETSYILET